MYKFFTIYKSYFVPISKLNTMSNKRSFGDLALAGKIGYATNMSFIPFIFCIVLLGFRYSFMPFDALGGGGGGANVDTHPIIPLLKEMMVEVDILRRSAMHQYNQALEVASFNAEILKNNTNTFANAFPNLTQQYTDLQESFNTFLNSNRELASSQFQAYIAPLDAASDRIEAILEEIDPSYIPDPDTDDEDMQKA